MFCGGKKMAATQRTPSCPLINIEVRQPYPCSDAWGSTQMNHDASENYNRAVPADEVALFSKPIREFVEKVPALAHSAAAPSPYPPPLLARPSPPLPPYQLTPPPSF